MPRDVTRGGGPRRLVAVSHTGLVSGAERVLLRVLAAGRTAGWSVGAVAPTGALAGELGTLGIRPTTIPELKLPALPRALGFGVLAARWLRAAPAIRRAASGADVVVVNGVLTLPSLAAARLGSPVAWLVHDVLRRADARAIVRAFGRVVTVAVALSEAVAEPLRRAGLRVVVIPNGTPWPVEPSRPSAGPAVVGINAMLTAWKGHDVLLDAFERLEHRDAVLECVGGTFPKDEAYAARLRRRAETGPLAGRVRFSGHVDRPLERMRGWTVAVSASIDPEAAPLSVLEAMSVGLPVVGTDHGGTPEALGDAGVLVPPRDAAALARAIDGLLDDPDLRDRLGAAARSRIADRFTLDVQEQRLLTLFGQLAQ